MPRIMLRSRNGHCITIESSNPRTVADWFSEWLAQFPSTYYARDEISLEVWPLAVPDPDVPEGFRADWPLPLDTVESRYLTVPELERVADLLHTIAAERAAADAAGPHDEPEHIRAARRAEYDRRARA